MSELTLREQILQAIEGMTDEQLQQVLERIRTLQAQAERAKNYDPAKDPMRHGLFDGPPDLAMQANSNHFGLEDPGAWFCNVEAYGIGHSELQLRLWRHRYEDSLFINFIRVQYFEGPIRWVGANFGVAAKQECLRILRATNTFDLQSDDSLFGDYDLFIADIKNSKAETSQVKIIAAPASFLSKENLRLSAP